MARPRNAQFTLAPLPLVGGILLPQINCDVSRSLDIYRDVEAIIEISLIAPEEELVDILFQLHVNARGVRNGRFRNSVILIAWYARFRRLWNRHFDAIALPHHR